MLCRQELVCYRCFRWKTEDSDEPLRNGIFLGILGSLYDTFGIHSKGMKPDGVSLKQAKENVTKIDSYVKDTVSKVKERYQLSETSATNGPQGTVSQKTQVSVSLLKKGIERLYKNVMDIHPQFVDDLLLETLLTTVVENLHAVSHLKHETFCKQQLGTICKKSLKRTSRWAAKYYTHDKSYYLVPQSAMPLSAIATMTPLSSEDITPGMEGQIKEWLESYRPVRQRLGVRPQKIRLRPCRQLSTPFTTPTSLKRGFDILKKPRIVSKCTRRCQHTICGRRGCY